MPHWMLGFQTTGPWKIQGEKVKAPKLSLLILEFCLGLFPIINCLRRISVSLLDLKRWPVEGPFNWCSGRNGIIQGHICPEAGSQAYPCPETGSPSCLRTAWTAQPGDFLLLQGQETTMLPPLPGQPTLYAWQRSCLCSTSGEIFSSENSGRYSSMFYSKVFF